MDTAKYFQNGLTELVEIWHILNSKFPPPVELCWQNENICKLGILITKVGNIIIFLT
jgi:hypothetical protein